MRLARLLANSGRQPGQFAATPFDRIAASFILGQAKNFALKFFAAAE
jgi:hypothetical protein